MPYVDLITETIVGCKKGTKEWYHEEGHIVYNKSELGIRNNYLQCLYEYLAITFTVIAFIIDLVWFLALASVIMFWYYFNYEERWCWKYAYKKLKQDKKS